MTPRSPRRLLAATALATLILPACGGSSIDVATIPLLPDISPSGIAELVAESDQPVVLNVWASWCAPCRSEAPLLRAAHAEFGDLVRFIGIDVRDTQDGARSFIAEFDLGGFEHFFDPTGGVPADLGGFGVPLTFFFAPGGRLMHLHSGVIDERTLALQIDEQLAG